MIVRMRKPGPVMRWAFARRGERVPTASSRSGWVTVVGLAVPYRFRRFHQAWAAFGGFFWIACPECDEKFAGYEGAVPEPFAPRLICRRCSLARQETA